MRGSVPATSPTSLPESDCDIQPALAADARRRRQTAADRSPTASSTAAAPLRSSAPNAAQRPPASPPAAPAISTPRGSRGSRSANSSSRSSSRATASGPAPFCGPNVRAASSKRVRTSQSTTSFAPAQPTGIANRLHRSEPTVGRRAATRRHQHAPGHHRPTRRRSARPVPKLLASSASRSASLTSPSPDAWANSTIRAPIRRGGRRRPHRRAPGGRGPSAATCSPPSALQQHRHRPLATVREPGRGRPRRPPSRARERSPRPPRLALERPLERVRGDEKRMGPCVLRSPPQPNLPGAVSPLIRTMRPRSGSRTPWCSPGCCSPASSTRAPPSPTRRSRSSPSARSRAPATSSTTSATPSTTGATPRSATGPIASGALAPATAGDRRGGSWRSARSSLPLRRRSTPRSPGWSPSTASRPSPTR